MMKIVLTIITVVILFTACKNKANKDADKRVVPMDAVVYKTNFYKDSMNTRRTRAVPVPISINDNFHEQVTNHGVNHGKISFSRNGFPKNTGDSSIFNKKKKRWGRFARSGPAIP